MGMPGTKLWCAIGLIAVAAAGNAETKPDKAATMTVPEIRACMARNLVDRGALRDLGITTRDRDGKAHALKMRFYWKPAKSGDARVNLRLVEPMPIAGSSYLLLQKGRAEEVYFHLPGADRALHITGQNMSEPLWGTDFSYGEIKQVLGLLVVGETRRVADAKVGGRAAYALETQMSLDDSGYSRIVNYVDQAGCVLLKSEFFAKSDQPRKVLEADVSTLLNAEKYWLVLGYTMRDLRAGSSTQVTLSDFSIMERLPEKLFDPKHFQESFQ